MAEPTLSEQLAALFCDAPLEQIPTDSRRRRQTPHSRFPRLRACRFALGAGKAGVQFGGGGERWQFYFDAVRHKLASVLSRRRASDGDGGALRRAGRHSRRRGDLYRRDDRSRADRDGREIWRQRAALSRSGDRRLRNHRACRVEHRRAETVRARLVAEHGLRRLRCRRGGRKVLRLARREDGERARHRVTASPAACSPAATKVRQRAMWLSAAPRRMAFSLCSRRSRD